MNIIFAETEKGLRNENQDNFAVISQDDCNIQSVIICDGNGPSGKIMAEAAVRTGAGEILCAISKKRNKRISLSEIREIGLNAISKAGEHICLIKASDSKHLGSGSTITVVMISGNAVFCWWVGDSPALLFTEGKMIKLTDPPHTLAEELIAKGNSRESVMRQEELSSIITRCLGYEESRPDFRFRRLKSNYCILVSSDGTRCLPDDCIKEIVESGFFSRDIPVRVINAALAFGSDDNVTAVSIGGIIRRTGLMNLRRSYWKRRIGNDNIQMA